MLVSFFSTSIRDIFFYLHVMFDVEGTLSVLVTFPALLPGLKKMEHSIYCTFVEVDISKNKFEKVKKRKIKLLTEDASKEWTALAFFLVMTGPCAEVDLERHLVNQ